MEQRVGPTSRDAVLVEDAHVRPMMGFEILEPLPSWSVPYERVDPFLLVHARQLREAKATLVDEEKWIDSFVWHAPRGQRLQNLEAHHRADVGFLHENGISGLLFNLLLHLPHPPCACSLLPSSYGITSYKENPSQRARLRG